MDGREMAETRNWYWHKSTICKWFDVWWNVFVLHMFLFLKEKVIYPVEWKRKSFSGFSEMKPYTLLLYLPKNCAFFEMILCDQANNYQRRMKRICENLTRIHFLMLCVKCLFICHPKWLYSHLIICVIFTNLVIW